MKIEQLEEAEAIKEEMRGLRELMATQQDKYDACEQKLKALRRRPTIQIKKVSVCG